MKKIKKILRNKLLRSLFLLLLWVLLTVWYIVTFDTSFSIWSFNHSNNEINSLNFNLLNKGDSIRGEFIAQDNNLGIVSVRFDTYIRPPYKYEDQLLFRLKEKGSTTWYYSSVYRSGLIYDVPFFPFGFPQIENSKGKHYQFEIRSLNRNETNGVSIKNRFPIFQSKYKYNKNELLQDKKELLGFIILKFTNAFKTPDVIFASFTYILPFVFYFLWIFFLEKSFNKAINNIRKYFIGLQGTKVGFTIKSLQFLFSRLDNFIIFVVLVDTLFFQVKNTLVYLLILILWIKTLRLYTNESTKSFIIGISFLILCPILLLFNLGPTAENAAAWAFIFILSGLISEMFYSEKNQNKK